VRRLKLDNKNQVKAQPVTMESLAAQVAELQGKMSGADQSKKSSKATRQIKPIDWSKIDETVVTDLSVSLPTIPQEVDNDMMIKLKDNSYVARWVNIFPKRLSQALSHGFTYITKEDLDENYPNALTLDAEGHYRDTDVVAMKILKSALYPKLRANLERSNAFMKKNRTADDLRDELAGSNPAMAQAFDEGKIAFTDEETLVG
jgi:hypothetical protein